MLPQQIAFAKAQKIAMICDICGAIISKKITEKTQKESKLMTKDFTMYTWTKKEE